MRTKPGGLVALLLLAAYIGLTPQHISGVNDKVLHFTVFFLITVCRYNLSWPGLRHN
jgi:hypothetical protein